MWMERIVLYLLLPARVATDSTSLSSAVGALTFPLLLLWFLLASSVRWKAVRMTGVAVLLMGLGYAYVIRFHGEYIYQVRGIIRYGTYVLLFLLFSRSRIPVREIYRVYGGLVAFEILVCIVQRVGLGIERPAGTLIHSNHVTYFVAFYLALSLFQYGFFARSVLLFGFQLLLAGMGGTMVTLLFFFFHFRRRFRGIGYIAMVLVLLAASFVMRERLLEIGDTFGDLASRLDSANAGQTSSLVWRIVTWHNMIQEMLASGGGWMGLGLEYASLASPYFSSASHLDPHNDYVRIFLETGYAGLALFFLGMGNLLLWLRRLERASPLARTMKLSLLGILTAMLVGNVVVQSTLIWLVAILLGKVFQLAHPSKKEIEGCPPPHIAPTPS